MRCRDARHWLTAQRNEDLAQVQVDLTALQEHLEDCPECQAYRQQQRRLGTLLHAAAAPVSPSVSTERIMQAVRQQQRITQQLENMRSQQRSRIAYLQPVGPSLAAIATFTTASVPLLLFATFLIQPDLLVKALMLLGDVVDVFVILAQYLGAGLALVTRYNWLLSGVAFILLLLTGMWFRLMRTPPQEA